MPWFWSVSLAILLLPAQTLCAQGSSGSGDVAAQRSWMLVVSALGDEDGYQHAYAGFHLGLEPSTWLSLALGKSRAPSSDGDVGADLFVLGVEHSFGTVGLGLSGESWGDSYDLVSRDWRAELFFTGRRYRVGLTRELREIDVYFSGDGASMETDLGPTRVDADGWGLDWRFRFAPRWRLYGSWLDYDHPRRLRLVPRAERLDLLSTSAVMLAYSLVDWYRSVGIERALGQKLLSLEYTHDRSAITRATLSSLSSSILWPVSPRVDLEFRLGVGQPEVFESTTYAGFSVLLYGGG